MMMVFVVADLVVVVVLVLVSSSSSSFDLLPSSSLPVRFVYLRKTLSSLSHPDPFDQSASFSSSSSCRSSYFSVSCPVRMMLLTRSQPSSYCHSF